jgi:hypothetical protein
MKLDTNAALVLRPTMPFIKWVKSTTNGSEWADEILEVIKEKSKQDGHTYLIPPLDSDEDLDRMLAQNAPDFLTNELTEWQVDPELWPPHLGEGLLRQWFTVSYSEMVFNLLPDDQTERMDFSGNSNLQS